MNNYNSNKRKKISSRAPSPLGRLISGTLTVAGGWILYSKLGINHHEILRSAVTAERNTFFNQDAGELSYYSDRQGGGRPLVLLHSINAAASAYEMRPLFEHYRTQRPVYALDLPGYGFSDRANRVYSPALFSGAILDFLTQVVKEPADVVALSLTSEFAAQAALEQPESFHSLVLISPTGFSAPKTGRGSQRAGASGASELIYPVFSFPLWRQAFFDLIATRASIKYFLEQSFVGTLPNSMIDYAYDSSHQPGAENVPLYFISGKLFTPDAREMLYQKVHTPSLVVYDHDPYTSFTMLPDLLSKNNHWRAVRILPTMGLPHWDELAQTTQALDSFWKDIQE